jgi:hypothetical protein
MVASRKDPAIEARLMMWPVGEIDRLLGVGVLDRHLVDR